LKDLSTNVVLTILGAAVALACTSSQGQSNSAISSYLADAVSADDPRFLPAVSAVLSDIENHTYQYDDDARKWAFNAIERLSPNNEAIRIRVRAIAAMSMTAGDRQRSLDEFVAIMNALGLLSDVGDTKAVDLNVMHLRDSLLGPAAVENLRSMRAWDVTAEVESGLISFLASPHECQAESSYLRFLSDSPRTSRASCALVTRALSDSESRSLCDSGRIAAIELDARLRCSQWK
jgi:hypothetical protein